jgi:hypothetical protein
MRKDVERVRVGRVIMVEAVSKKSLIFDYPSAFISQPDVRTTGTGDSGFGAKSIVRK